MSDTASTTRQARYERFREALFEHMTADLRRSHQTMLRQTPRPDYAHTPPAKRRDKHALNIGIVGGGMAGLYAGMLLDTLGIGYHIFEASGERLGGRVYTYYFDNAPHQYAELGAMRFPLNFMQSRLFNFWDYLNRTAANIPGAREIPRIPYILHDPTSNPDGGNLLCFNGQPPVTRNQAAADNRRLGFDAFFDDPQWDYFKSDGVLKPAQDLLDAAIDRFVDLFETQGIGCAWDELLKYDRYSARGYLQDIGDGHRPYPSRIVDYIETVLTYTGIYDLALIELVLDQFSFHDTKQWYALDGGTSRITQEMANRVPAARVSLGAEVWRMEQHADGATLHTRHGRGTPTASATFDRVIVTLPFSVLRFIDTPTSWSAGKYEAIRMLKMTNATKIALGFKTRFWERPGPYSCGMKGGQSDTDLPVRSIVYPSFGIGESGPGYILGSYCWQWDSDKFSHLDTDQLLDAALRDVAKLHGEEIVTDNYLGHGAAVVWNREKFAGGGFEFFASGQFGQLFLQASEPEGRFHFAGEHLDMVHYWIAGSFNSAFRTVWEVLILEGLDTPENLRTLFTALGGGKILPTMIPHIHGEGSLAQAERLLAEIA